MYLKSIEIRGFKSFADKTELKFRNGITAVVGPNGSGKSNITDAVRWVLGEQSIKTLRGGRMEDVIFAGTQFRKPVSLAQVSLTLDNSDGALSLEYSDVTISRRLYRSGESEYYINNTQCRLKDVLELFMDTGIGKEGYSIIGQGKIDAVLSGKPEERRNLLEEAAGIVKFKSRKEEAEKKLQNTEHNLIRINDILSTYEERIEPLRIDNEKAKLFIALSDELKHKEVSLIVDSIYNLQEKLKSLQQDLLKINEETTNFNLEKETAKNESREWSLKLEEFEAVLGNKKQDYYDSKDKYQKVESECNILRERIDNLNHLISKNSQEIDSINEKLESNQIERNNIQSMLSEFYSEQKSLNVSIDSFQKNIDSISNSLNDNTEACSRLKNEKIELLNIISNNKNNIALLANEVEQLEKKVETLAAACNSYSNSIKINNSTKLMIDKEVISLKEKIEKYDAQIVANKKEITVLNNELNNEEARLKNLNAEHNKIEANRNMLINLDKHYEGYNKSVKLLMQHIDERKIPEAFGRCSVLGEILNVEKDFEIAIEVSLGGAISDIITEDESIAKKLIGYLKTNNLGRATFLPLTIIKGKKIINNASVASIEGYIGIASELIQYNEQFKSAVEYVLGRTIISKDMDSALRIAKVTSYSFKIVTLTGEVVNPGGSLTGGSLYQKNLGIMGRKREIEELYVKLNEIKDLIEKTTNKVNDDKEKIKNLDDTCLNLKDRIHYENIEITKHQSKISAIDIDTNKLQQNLKVSIEEERLISLKIIKSKEKLELMHSTMGELIDKDKNNDSVIDSLEADLKLKKEEVSGLSGEITEQKVKKAQFDEMVSNKERDLERFKREIEENSKSYETVKKETEEAENSKKEYADELNNNQIFMKSILSCITELEHSFLDNEAEILKIKENIKRFSGIIEEKTLIAQKKDEELHKLELMIARLDTEQGTFYAKLNEEYQLTYAEAMDLKQEIMDVNVWKKAISSLKSQISDLGVVNLGAIEEYETTKGKYYFMNSQKEDLSKAKDELSDVIEEMTSKMKNIFSEKFLLLRKNFNETFRELFKGGNADLILSEGDELSANIEINVQPSGKKLQNINLMSGGEKVLSAIALLFAILKMKPTPFCILDEIEAALDDANVFRYAEFLKKFSETTQFIVITHRKGTMEASDILYGVTMEEKGISKIVSVNLTN